VEVQVLDLDGDPVARLLDGEKQSAGPQRGAWDGTGRGGSRAPAGQYLLEIRARATYSSRSSWERKVTRSFQLGTTP